MKSKYIPEESRPLFWATAYFTHMRDNVKYEGESSIDAWFVDLECFLDKLIEAIKKAEWCNTVHKVYCIATGSHIEIEVQFSEGNIMDWCDRSQILDEIEYEPISYIEIRPWSDDNTRYLGDKRAFVLKINPD